MQYWKIYTVYLHFLEEHFFGFVQYCRTREKHIHSMATRRITAHNIQFSRFHCCNTKSYNLGLIKLEKLLQKQRPVHVQWWQQFFLVRNACINNVSSAPISWPHNNKQNTHSSPMFTESERLMYLLNKKCLQQWYFYFSER